ncbi:hypothetical protein [Roseovarius aestuarii]|uniref:Uncharacterized protein n=1 Tax=Roseovarius aestuarii TaxID=475083 RepID=A0A1X7BQ69_9RHOB|nr:hypothetical protein [Roseovarius aestuarii]SMC11816.1 hypothetical protein ROA7745_01635 [Roseovarius aestuarii]
MAKDDYERFNLVWQDRIIEVSYQANWLNSGHWHLELRCDDPLPVTGTGYRSCFVPAHCLEGAEAIEVYILNWLDHSAEDPEWLKLLEENRQLSLF